MKHVWKLTAAAAAMAGSALFASAPAEAFGVGISIGVPGIHVGIGVPGAIGYDIHSGGFCDRWGCPDGYWDYPVWYGPVYYGGGWYQGPVYYRDYDGARWFWIHGDWHRDEWVGPRPGWWSSSYYYGPALGFEYYHDHGFYISSHYWDYWHAHGGYDWERAHHVDWRGDYHGGFGHGGGRDHGDHDHGDHGHDREMEHGGRHAVDHDHAIDRDNAHARDRAHAIDRDNAHARDRAHDRDRKHH